MNISVTIDGVARLEFCLWTVTCWNAEKTNVMVKVI